ncbi:MAG: hypothetical protein K9M44_02950 [Candidatus Pacebacteria bacterium]|nr:hypothetical protein [Candidatus Paceibacterota bacterium]
MQNIKRLQKLIWFLPWILLLLFELIYFQPEWFYYLLILSNLVLIVSVWLFSKDLSKKFLVFKLLILPWLFLNFTLFYAIISVSSFLTQATFVISAFLLFLYFQASFKKYYQPLAKSIFKIGELSFFLSFLAVFLASASVFGLKSFLNFPSWQLIIFLAPIIFLLLLQLFWFQGLKAKSNIYTLLILLLLLLEIIWGASFLTFSYLMIGLIVAISFYVLAGITIAFENLSLDKRSLRYYINFALIGFLLIFLSSRWL